MGGNHATSEGIKSHKMCKDFREEQVMEFMKAFHNKYKGEIKIVNFGLSIEWKIQDTIPTDKMPYIAAPELLKYAEAFVSVDSCLQHFSACKGVEKKGVVWWGATSPNCFGYKQNVNLIGTCPHDDLHCTRPYFRHTSDFVGKGLPWQCKTKKCMNVSIKKIMEKLDKIFKGSETKEEKKIKEDKKLIAEKAEKFKEVCGECK